MKAFPMREQHFFCSVSKAMRDLDWSPKYPLLKGLQDSYENDFKVKKVSLLTSRVYARLDSDDSDLQASGKLVEDFAADDIVLKGSVSV